MQPAIDTKLEKYVDDYLKQMATKITKINEESQLNLKQKIESLPLEKQADKDVVQKITASHIPQVRLLPGTPRWDDFTSTIKSIQTRKTICMSIDIEAWEKNPNIVTELGISIWDPRTETGIYPLSEPQFENHHIIIDQALHLRNTQYTPDHKYQYLMGKTKVMDLRQCQLFVQSLIDKYMVPEPQNTAENSVLQRAFVGHGFAGDAKWLRGLQIRVPEETPVFDTMKLFQSMYGATGSGLGKALRLLNIPHAYMHNAGNDAYYTLKLLLHMCDIGKRKLLNLDDIGDIQLRIEKWRSHDSPHAPPGQGNRKRSKAMVKTEFQGVEPYSTVHASSGQE